MRFDLIINIQDDILKLNNMGLLEKLLVDKTTKGNIMWATDAYDYAGQEHEKNKEITVRSIIGNNSDMIKTRARREMEHRQNRVKSHGEVSTPLWLCRRMTRDMEKACDSAADWKTYVSRKCLEITCGEAPFLVSRYDIETGEMIRIGDRIGILDKKISMVNENAYDRNEWIFWVTRAFESTYGYEFQGDNLIIARVNLIMTFEEYYEDRWNEKPLIKEYEKIINIITWNLWQMDGLTGTIPYYETEDFQQISMSDLFFQSDAAEKDKLRKPLCRVYNWRRGSSICFSTMREEKRKMKFDFIIGNPPYQEEQEGDNKTYAPPIYHKFMDAAYKISDRVELIHPARFLFNAGSTPKPWNRERLNDPHFKVLWYEQNSSKVFSHTDIKGGVAVTYRDAEKDYGAIGIFTPFEELNRIMRKVKNREDFESLSSIVVTRTAYRLTDKMHEDHPDAADRLSKGHAYDMSTNIFDRLPDIFFDEEPQDGAEYIKILGRKDNERVYKCIRKDYVNEVVNLKKWKIFVPKSNGSGALGEVLATPLIGRPLIGNTESFISIGICETQDEAVAVLKYIKTKFARCMLGVLKVTQDNPPDKWGYVPLQDFTSSSDIDWSAEIPDIDKQLYEKYGLDENEIQFIESHVKEME